MNRAIARASCTDDLGVFHLIVEARESGYALIHRGVGAHDAAAVAFSTGDELRAILPALPTANVSYAGARERLISQWEAEAKSR